MARACAMSFLVLGILVGRAMGESVTVMQYQTADASVGTSTEYPGAVNEMHCIVKNANGVPTYVKGTYGMYGYFEGPFVNNNSASINFYEVTATGVFPGRPISGAGLLTYSQGFQTAVGPYWPTGTSDVGDTSLAGNWNAVGGVQNGTAGQCLFSPTGKRSAQNPFVSRNIFTFNKKGNKNVFCSDIREQTGTTGTVLGTYTYTYTMGDDCVPPCTANNTFETGSYGEGAVSFIGRDSFGVATQWVAVTGPFAGMTGSALYIFANKGMAGFFCNTEPEPAGGGLKRTACFLETYPSTGSGTFANCAAGYSSGKSPKVVKLGAAFVAAGVGGH